MKALSILNVFWAEVVSSLSPITNNYEVKSVNVVLSLTVKF